VPAACLLRCVPGRDGPKVVEKGSPGMDQLGIHRSPLGKLCLPAETALEAPDGFIERGT